MAKYYLHKPCFVITIQYFLIFQQFSSNQDGKQKQKNVVKNLFLKP